MEIIGVVLLVGLFALGVGFVYLFLQYIDLLKSIKSINESISNRLKALEDRLGDKATAAAPAPGQDKAQTGK
jgi:hypothetical protein